MLFKYIQLLLILFSISSASNALSNEYPEFDGVYVKLKSNEFVELILRSEKVRVKYFTGWKNKKNFSELDYFGSLNSSTILTDDRIPILEPSEIKGFYISGFGDNFRLNSITNLETKTRSGVRKFSSDAFDVAAQNYQEHFGDWRSVLVNSRWGWQMDSEKFRRKRISDNEVYIGARSDFEFLRKYSTVKKFGKTETGWDIEGPFAGYCIDVGRDCYPFLLEINRQMFGR